MAELCGDVYDGYENDKGYEPHSKSGPVDAEKRKKLTDISRALRWDDFGFEGRDGEKSTIWIGTEG